MPDDKIQMIAREILGLTMDELRQLNNMLEEGGGEALGVREPRVPLPPHDMPAAQTLPLPEDYWESAQ